MHHAARGLLQLELECRSGESFLNRRVIRYPVRRAGAVDAARVHELAAGIRRVRDRRDYRRVVVKLRADVGRAAGRIAESRVDDVIGGADEIDLKHRQGVAPLRAGEAAVVGVESVAHVADLVRPPAEGHAVARYRIFLGVAVAGVDDVGFVRAVGYEGAGSAEVPSLVPGAERLSAEEQNERESQREPLHQNTLSKFGTLLRIKSASALISAAVVRLAALV